MRILEIAQIVSGFTLVMTGNVVANGEAISNSHHNSQILALGIRMQHYVRNH